METNPLIRKLEGYSALTEADKSFIEDLSSERIEEYGAKSDIISEGDRPDFVHLVLEGWAARYKILPDGSRRLMAFLIPGDFCDLHITVLARMDHGIMALTPCKVAHLDSKRLSDAASQYSTLTRALWWMTLVDEAVLRQWVINVGRPANAAIAHLLCELHQRMKSVGLATGNRLELPLTQEEVAEATGITPVHVNRTLQTLRGQGLIELKARSLFIPDIGALAEAGGFDERYLHLQKDEERRGG